ncbi:hypothetical protein Mpsy_0186 [Methanolobus psychrophilus R15]|nr:hypothetical protein Mpsy_0186 [Methanolobus psychrophilus R15]
MSYCRSNLNIKHAVVLDIGEKNTIIKQIDNNIGSLLQGET